MLIVVLELLIGFMLRRPDSGAYFDQQDDVVALLLAENRLLRARLKAVAPRRRLLLRDGERRRLGTLAARVGRRALDALELTFSPETLLRWYRKQVAAKYDGSKQLGTGRPTVNEEVAAWIVRMAEENETWGVRRISGALANLDLVASASTARRVLADAGMPPSPTRKRELRWADFLRRHREAIAAADFLTVEVLTKLGLVRYHVLFAIHLACRRVHIAGIVREPDGAYVEQKARETENGHCFPWCTVHRSLIFRGSCGLILL